MNVLPFVRLSSIEKHKWITNWCVWISYWLSTEFSPCWLYRCGLFLNVTFDELKLLRQQSPTLIHQWQNLLNKIWREKGELFPHVWVVWLQYVDKLEAFLEFQKSIQWENIFFPTDFKIEISDTQWKNLYLIECVWFCHSTKTVQFPNMSTEQRMAQIGSQNEFSDGFTEDVINSVKSGLEMYIDKK